MGNIKKFSIILYLIGIVNASYRGPYLLWGAERLQGVQLPALKAIDENVLTNLFIGVKSVVIFLRNGTSTLGKGNFPTFQELVSKTNSSYLPQSNLPADPLDYSSNVEIIKLVGPPLQQDAQLTTLYRNSVAIYGQGDVLGILANYVNDLHFIQKRSISQRSSSLINSAKKPKRTSNLYEAEGNCLLYTTSVPTLTLEPDIFQNVVELTKHTRVDFEVENQRATFTVYFNKTILRFLFFISQGYWSLDSVEVKVEDFQTVLKPVAYPPEAPIGFSFSCFQPVIFENGSDYLKFTDIQLQPLLGGQKHFSDAYNCVGFMTVPIWSGIFVSGIVILGTFAGILAIMDIKTPTRFDCSRNKQPTFIVQE